MPKPGSRVSRSGGPGATRGAGGILGTTMDSAVEGESSGGGSGALIGGIVGALLCLVCIVLLVLFLLAKRRKDEENKEVPEEPASGTPMQIYGAAPRGVSESNASAPLAEADGQYGELTLARDPAFQGSTMASAQSNEAYGTLQTVPSSQMPMSPSERPLPNAGAARPIPQTPTEAGGQYGDVSGLLIDEEQPKVYTNW